MILQIAFKSVKGKLSNTIKSLKELGKARLLKDKSVNLDSDIENCFFNLSRFLLRYCLDLKPYQATAGLLDHVILLDQILVITI